MFGVGLFASCEKAFMSPDLSASAVNTFDYLWTKVDQQYSMFDVKDAFSMCVPECLTSCATGM